MSRDPELLSLAAVAERTARLRAWRTATAAAQGIPAYRVLTNATLAALAATVVQGPADLRRVPGIGPVSCRSYGAAWLALLVARAGEEPELLGPALAPAAPEPPRLRDRPAIALPAPGWVPPLPFAAALRGLKVRERVALDLYYGVTLGTPASVPAIAALLGVQETRVQYHLQLGWNRLLRQGSHPPAGHPCPAAAAALLAALRGEVEQV